MLDLDWERSVPVIEMQIGELKSIFNKFDKMLKVIEFHAVQGGCRNSNFVVSTNKGKFLVRAANRNDLNNETTAYELVKDRIPVPKLLFHTMKQKTIIFIYQYINGVSLQKRMIESGQCDHALLEQVARAAAVIHNTPKENTIGLAEFDVPPFELWYQYFLDDATVKARIGKVLHERVWRLVLDRQKLIPEIDSYQSLIHCDFRPANMLVDEHDQVFFVDWEYACWGHSLADIGQFFRYRSFFQETHIALFEQIYHTFANRRLPDHWFELSLFRDLVNPLQMLSSNQEAPVRNSDLVNILEGTVRYFGY